MRLLADMRQPFTVSVMVLTCVIKKARQTFFHHHRSWHTAYYRLAYHLLLSLQSAVSTTVNTAGGAALTVLV